MVEPVSNDVSPANDGTDGARTALLPPGWPMIAGRRSTESGLGPSGRFEVEVGANGASGACADVHGFREVALTALDASLGLPSRLVVVAPDVALSTLLDAWAEDDAQIHRSLLVRRRADGREVSLIATLASHGAGVLTSLCVESVRGASREDEDHILRSGVHSRAEIAAALARYDEP